jgi:hypothetical protein
MSPDPITSSALFSAFAGLLDEAAAALPARHPLRVRVRALAASARLHAAGDRDTVDIKAVLRKATQDAVGAAQRRLYAASAMLPAIRRALTAEVAAEVVAALFGGGK